MTDKLTKLQEVIEIAIEGDFSIPISPKDFANEIWKEPYFLPAILFLHKFAKAYWGEEKIADQVLGEYSGKIGDYRSDGFDLIPLWQFHIQQAVISDDPIGYYWKNKPKE